MNGQEFKVLANHELDVAAKREMGRLMTFTERQQWWTSPQGGIEEPYLLVVTERTEDMEAVIKAAREWKP